LSKPFYILFFLFVSPSFGEGWGEVSAQTNLIYNGDFELYDTCPLAPSSPSNLEIERCIGWTAPTKLGTSDYFNTCNNMISGAAGVPQNWLGYQQPLNGNGYVGIYAWAVSSSFPFLNYREYIQTKLTKKLESGSSYHFSFYVSYYGTNYSVEKIGALFSVNDYNSNSFSPIIATPQIINLNGYITDSLVWTKIEGNFTANGGEEFLTIGYFEDSLTVMDTLNTYSEPLVFWESYYFIDGVELFLNDLIIPNIFSPNGDGINELFNIKGLSTEDKVIIYDRWGIKIYEFSGIDDSWDGRTISGAECSSGIYYYIVHRKNRESHKGFIQLLR